MTQEEVTINENNENIVDNEVNQSAEQQQEVKTIDDNSDSNKETVVNNDVAVKEIDEKEVLSFLKKSKGINVESLDDILNPKQVNPYENLLDEEDKAYFNFKKETGRSRKDFEALNSNLDDLPKIELARERVRKETGLTLSNEQVDEYVADVLGIDLEDMSASDQIKLASYTKSILDEKKAEQKKYSTPIEDKKQSTNNEEYVTLENGAVMLKSQYDNLINTRQQEILRAKEAVNSVTNSDFKITIDDKGTPKEMNFTYEYSEEDKQSMVSVASDIDSVINARYSSEKGFDHKRFVEDIQWSDPKFREKAIGSLLHKAIAKNTEDILKERGNVNFSQDTLPRQAKEGVKIVSMADAIRGNI